MITEEEFIRPFDVEKHDITRIRSAYHYAKQMHEGQERKYEDKPYLIHPIRVASLLADENDDMIIAGFLHDIIEKTSHGKDDIEERFGSTIADLVDGMSKSADRGMFEALEQYIDTYPELLIIRMADRLDNMQTKYDSLSEETKQRYQQETEKMIEMAKEREITKFVSDLEEFLLN